jgi:hypothetical protein
MHDHKHTPMRQAPHTLVIYTPIRCMPMRYTPIRYVHVRHIPNLLGLNRFTVHRTCLVRTDSLHKLI